MKHAAISRNEKKNERNESQLPLNRRRINHKNRLPRAGNAASYILIHTREKAGKKEREREVGIYERIP